MSTYNTHTKQFTDEPAHHATAPAPSVNDVAGPAVDVGRAIGEYDARITRLEGEASDATSPPGARYKAYMEAKSLKAGREYQIAIWQRGSR